MSSEPTELKSEVVAFKRRRILEVSAHLFFEQGYEGTTLDAVAEQLQVTKPYLYSYFQNKGEILFEICQTGIRESLAALEQALALEDSPRNRLRAAVAQVAQIVIAKREYVVVYMREDKNLSSADAQEILDQRRAFDRKVAALLEEGVTRGEFSVRDLSLTATTIGGIVSWLPRWYVPTGRVGASEVVAIIVDLVQKMVRRDEPSLEGET